MLFFSGGYMQDRQDWQTENYKGMEVHVCAVRHGNDGNDGDRWDFEVRVAQPGEDAAYESELTAETGEGAALPSREKAIEAGFAKGYALVDKLVQ
jgi:hypothetical protein